MAHGDDRDSGLGNIKDAMQFRIERIREWGRPVPKSEGEHLMLG